jgi:putative heme iron utilization protein
MPASKTVQSSTQHGGSAPAAPQVPQPSHAERTRTLFSLHLFATLCTQSSRLPGFPFGSLMPYALDAQGRPLLLISNMAMHTHNLRANANCSLFVSEHAEGDPLGAARATFVGRAAPVAAGDLSLAREQYLASHPGSRYWVDFTDFHFFVIEPVELYFVGGFGVMGWVSSEAYTRAAPDPLASSASGILKHMNADHQASLLRLAETIADPELGGATEARMTSVDRLGFTLRLVTPRGVKGTRINFSREVADVQQTRQVLVEMVRAAEIGQTNQDSAHD